MALTDSLPVRGPQPRILIVRLSALGDIVFATSLLDGLRSRYPQAHIAWLAQSGFAGVLEGDPRIDQLLRIPKESLKSPAALLALRRELTEQAYDWVLDCQGLLKSRMLARLAGGATRIGFTSKEPGKALMHHLLPKGGEPADISSEYRYMAEQLTGIPAGPPRLVVTAEGSGRIAEAMAALGLAPGFVALCPFTTRPQKHWREEYWPQLARQLASQGLGPFVIFGGPADRPAAERIHAQLPPGSLNLAGETRLPDLGGWLSPARLVIGVDTGLTHIGIAMRRPTLALFGSTCPYTRGADSPLAVMYDGLPCAPCRRHPTCGGDWTCMKQLTPARVAAQAVTLLGLA
ncbi:glycosyltransferase family 9 protein [Solimonas fluminis]|uniref:Glycosyltransferase family 9 protein n=1 Tax=Solimonas fluminis TaxID=2086571 RepID=A0A2S5TFA5_9GAMM|nr:glycosyltransferase family 9 protein [Solimonas fluminis]PPE73665.1 glycosyltransferase family 9 protein [Solimonas fluminis]